MKTGLVIERGCVINLGEIKPSTYMVFVVKNVQINGFLIMKDIILPVHHKIMNKITTVWLSVRFVFIKQDRKTTCYL